MARHLPQLPQRCLKTLMVLAEGPRLSPPPHPRRQNLLVDVDGVILLDTMLHDLRGDTAGVIVTGGPFSLTRAEMESGRDERHPPVFSHPSRLQIFNGGNIYPAKGWKLVPTVFKLLLGGK